MKKVYFATILFILSFASAFSIDAVYLFKGKIIDAETKKPLGLEIQFKSNKNRVFIANSNSKDGSFQQILPPGATYNYMFKGYFCDEFKNELVLKNIDKYDEIEKTFEVRKIKEGDLVFTGDLFKANDTSFADVNDFTIDAIKDALNFQKNLVVKVYVNINDCKFKPKKVKSPDGGKKAKQITITPQDQAKEMMNSRINVLQKTFKERNIRLSGVEFLPLVETTKTKNKQNENMDIKIIAVKLSKF